MGQRQPSGRPGGRGDHGQRPRADGRGRGVRGGQGRRRPAVRAGACTSSGCSGRQRAWGCRSSTRGWSARASRRCWPRAGWRWAGSGSPTPAGRRRWGRDAATSRRRWSWSRRRWPARPPTATVADGAVAAQRAGGARGPEDDVVRRERGRPGRGQAPRGDRGGVREPRGAPVRGHREQRLLRRRRRAADADAGQRLPGRRDPRAGPRVGRWRARSTSRSRSSGRPARCSWRRPRATSRASRGGTTASSPAPGPGDRRRARHLAPPRARAAGRLSHAPDVSRRRTVR